MATLRNVAPGEHTLEAVKPQYRSRSIPLRVAEGDNKPIELRLERAPGIVEVERDPANSTVTYTRGGEAPVVLAGARKEMTEGSYNFTARAPGFQEHTAVVQVVADQKTVVSFSLKPMRTEAPEATLADWGSLWTRGTEDQWYRPGISGTLLFPRAPVAGTIQFTTIWERTGIFRKGAGSVGLSTTGTKRTN